MTGEPGATRAPRPSTDERAQGQDVLGLGERERDALLAWVGENLTLVQRAASGQRTLYWSLGICFVVGLAAHVGGFLLKILGDDGTAGGAGRPALHARLGTVDRCRRGGVHPALSGDKKRQYKQALDAYEVARGDQARAGSGRVLLGGAAGLAEVRTSRIPRTARA
jgi:hypothetical protein